jgi:dTDP-4-dehydrorhamnose reductase
MLRLAQVRKSIRLVADQWGNPTSALDLADAILHMLPRLEAAHFGVYHLAGQGATNWSGLASHVLSVSGQSGGPHAEIEEIPSSEYPTLAVRPLNSQLSSKLFEQSFGWRMPNWEESASLVTKRLVGASPTVDDLKSEKC